MVKKIVTMGMAVLTTVGCGSKSEEHGMNMSLSEYEKHINNVVVSTSDITSLFPKTSKEIEEYTKFGKELARKELDTILKIGPTERTFDNLVQAFDDSQERLCRVLNVVHLLNVVSPDKEVRDAAHRSSVELSQFSIDLYVTKELYNAFIEYLEHKGKLEQLDKEQEYFLKETIRDFKREGLNLSDDKLSEVKELGKKISKICLDFEQNINADKSSIKVRRKDLNGLEGSFIDGLKRDGEKYILGCDYPTYSEIMQNCCIEKTRKNLYLAFQNRAYPQNIDLLHKIVAKRDELAKKLGFGSFAALDIDSAMANTPKKASAFLQTLISASKKKANKEFDKLKKDLPEGVILDGLGKMSPWDYSYVVNCYKKKHFAVDERKISEYFPEQKTINGIFNIYQKFLSLDFCIIDPDWSWHEDVKLIKICDKISKKLLGYIFLDLYPRDDKYSHACCGSIVNGRIKKNFIDGHYQDIPYVGFVIANFPKATGDRPALLKHNDVVTFFHEFGHAMHGLLGRTKFASTSGTNTKRDFVETPSQMLEEWMWNEEMIKIVSGHYKTGNVLPNELVKKKIALKKCNSGHHVLTQLLYSFIALEYFSEGSDKDTNVILEELSKKMIEYIRFEPKNHFQAAFGHLIGYGAKYYGYMWSKVFALDVFYEIKKHGLLNEEVGQKLIKLILSKGGGVDPNELLESFLGRKPSQEAFLDDLGFV
jgi:thimet oligopeptidase